MGVLWSSDILRKATQLFREHQQDLVLVVQLILKEDDELVTSSLRSEG
jgi:hypothetical protein